MFKLDYIIKTIMVYVEIKPGVIINEDTNIRNELGINSYDIVNIVMAIENEFDIVINDMDIIKFRVVGDLIENIEKARKNRFEKSLQH